LVYNTRVYVLDTRCQIGNVSNIADTLNIHRLLIEYRNADRNFVDILTTLLRSHNDLGKFQRRFDVALSATNARYQRDQCRDDLYVRSQLFTFG